MRFEMNGIEWTVCKVPANSVELRRSNGTFTVGMCDGNRCIIFLCNKLHGDFLRKVFIHEVCHSAVFSYNIHIPVDEEEFLCDFVASHGDEIFSVVDNIFGVLKKAYIA